MKTINIGIEIDLYVYMADNGTLNPPTIRQLLDYCKEHSNSLGSPLTYYRTNEIKTIVYKLKVEEKLHTDLMKKAKNYGMSLVDYTAFIINSLYKDFEREVINE